MGRLPNLAVVGGDAAAVLARHVPACAAAVFVNHPEPPERSAGGEDASDGASASRAPPSTSSRTPPPSRRRVDIDPRAREGEVGARSREDTSALDPLKGRRRGRGVVASSSARGGPLRRSLLRPRASPTASHACVRRAAPRQARTCSRATSLRRCDACSCRATGTSRSSPTTSRTARRSRRRRARPGMDRCRCSRSTVTSSVS